MKRAWRVLRPVGLVLPLLTAACAPDAWHADSAFDAFLDKVRVNCWKTSIGSVSIAELMPDAVTTDAYFMDLSSRFYHGQTSRADYVAALEGTYMARPGSPGIACVLAQMPPGKDAPPPGGK